MPQHTYKASSPGSLMLTGEHAVLNGYPALVCAIDKRIYVTLKVREDNKFTIHSDKTGYFESSIQEINSISKFNLITTLLLHYQSYLTRGFDLEIYSDFPSVGLGSSGALVVSLLSVFQSWLFGQALPHSKFLALATHIIQQAQGVGSGADAAASLLGGIVYYHYQPLEFKKIDTHFPISVIYSGQKKATSDVVRMVKANELLHPSIFELLYQAISECSHSALQAIETKNWKSLGEIFNIQQGLMSGLGVNNPHLQSLVDTLSQDPGILGAKISGSGLGDCVIGLGAYEGEKVSKANSEWMNVEITEHGVFYG